MEVKNYYQSNRAEFEFYLDKIIGKLNGKYDYMEDDCINYQVLKEKVNDIIKRVSQATNFISVKIKEVPLRNYRFKNTPVLGDPQARIANVIAEMHAAKIHASFNAGSVLYK